MDEAARPYQGEEAGLDVARPEPDCDEDLVGRLIERIEEGSRSAVGLEKHDNQEQTVDSVAVERDDPSECAGVEGTLVPFRTKEVEK